MTVKIIAPKNLDMFRLSGAELEDLISKGNKEAAWELERRVKNKVTMRNYRKENK